MADDLLPLPRARENSLRRDWLGHWSQLGVFGLMLGGAILAGAHYVDTKFGDQALAFEHKLGEQSSQILVLQSQQTSLQHEVERQEERQQTFEDAVAKKLDTVASQTQAIATDLALLRREMHR